MDKLDETIHKFLTEKERDRGLGLRSGTAPDAEELYLFLNDKLEGSRLERVLAFLKNNPEWQEWAVKARGLIESSDQSEQVEVPASLLRKVKDSSPAANSARCPHCRQAITPFKKPISTQKLWVILWTLGAALSFTVSFLVPRYFFQFVALTVLFGVKAIVDHRSAKTQILIYKALHEDESTSGSINRLHQHEPHL